MWLRKVFVVIRIPTPSPSQVIVHPAFLLLANWKVIVPLVGSTFIGWKPSVYWHSTTNDIIVAYQSERNNIWDTLPVMHIGVRDPINLTRRIAAPATSLDSPGGGEY